MRPARARPLYENLQTALYNSMLSNFKTDRQDKKNKDYKILLAGAANITGKKSS
jgi:hypothetical protein